MSGDRKAVALMVAVAVVPAAVAGLAIGTMVAVAVERVRCVLTGPWWSDPDA